MKRLLFVLTLGLLMMVGVVSAHDHGVHVRVAHLSPESPAVDVTINGDLVIRQLGFKQTSGYLPVDGNHANVALIVDGNVIYEDVLAFAGTENGYFTIVAFGDIADLTFELFVLPEDSQPTGSATADNLIVRSAFARPTGMAGHGHQDCCSMGGVSAAYMVIENIGDADDTLISVETPVAERVELHETVITGDMAQMGEVEGGIVIIAGGIAHLRPGGLHVMLMELKQNLVEGATIPLTLTFASGTVITLEVPVHTP